MSRVFEFQCRCSIDEILAEGLRLAKENQIKVSGDSQTGTFTKGMLSGTYSVAGKTGSATVRWGIFDSAGDIRAGEGKVRVAVGQKPWLVPWGTIEGELRKFLESLPCC